MKALGLFENNEALSLDSTDNTLACDCDGGPNCDSSCDYDNDSD